MKLKQSIIPGLLLAFSAGMCWIWQSCAESSHAAEERPGFVRVEGHDLVKPDGSRLYIAGTNLGNWLNPEGYMFGFGKTNSPSMINNLFCQLIGPAEAASFWKTFKDCYITEADIRYIAQEGANTIRVPFHYKLFTDEDYMGLTSSQDGFERLDSVVEWCGKNNLYVILDMHDAPGGQTGDNIDDSYGYPFLMENEADKEEFCEIWSKIAAHYKDNPVILGYELINEPVATYFDNQDILNEKLVSIYKSGIDAIRKEDKDHIILIGAPQWNSNFSALNPDDFSDDPQIMYTCHRYGGEPTSEAIRGFIEFRNKSGRPMYMGEIGHNTDQWQRDFVSVLEENNIGYTFWPYKKIDGSCMRGISAPEGWDYIIECSESPRQTYADIRNLKINHELAKELLKSFLDSCRFENTHTNVAYVNSLHLK